MSLIACRCAVAQFATIGIENTIVPRFNVKEETAHFGLRVETAGG